MLGITSFLLSHVVSHNWIIDYGATYHVAEHKDIFSQWNMIYSTN